MSLLSFVAVIHWLAGVIVLAEALNKLERTAPFAKGLTPHQRLVAGLKALAWALLALGGAGAVSHRCCASKPPRCRTAA